MDKATKLARIKSIHAAALRAVEEIGSWHPVRMGSREPRLKGRGDRRRAVVVKALATEVLAAV